MQSPAATMPTPAAGVLPLSAAKEAAQRAEVVRHALLWNGTPYRQWGATRGVGVDCAMLLVRAFVDAGVFEEFDPRPYPPDWMRHRDEERYLAWLESLAVEVPAPRAGDIVVWRFARCFSHSGLMISDTRLMHAFAPWEICSQASLGDKMLAEFHEGMPRPRKFFSVWEKLRQVAR